MKHEQSKKWSLIEATVGVVVGFIVALLLQIIVFPIFDIDTTFGENFTIASIFTVASIIRGYYMRRLFNWMHHKKGYGNGR